MLKITIESNNQCVALCSLGTKAVFVHPGYSGTFVVSDMGKWSATYPDGSNTMGMVACFEITSCQVFMFNDHDLVTFVGQLKCESLI